MFFFLIQAEFVTPWRAAGMVVVWLSTPTGHNGSIKMPNLVFVALYTATNLLSDSVLSVEYEKVTLTLEKHSHGG